MRKRKIEFTVEKGCSGNLFASRQVGLEWRRNSLLLTDATEGFLSKAFTMNLFCSAVNIAVFLRFDFFCHTQQI